jgi:hypothetical protein
LPVFDLKRAFMAQKANGSTEAISGKVSRAAGPVLCSPVRSRGAAFSGGKPRRGIRAG